MRVTGLVPATEPAEVEGPALRDLLRERYERPGDVVRLNLVTALGGAITGPSGTSEDLTGGIDRTLLGVLRALSDVVLVGAGSLRAEGLGLPKRVPLAVATGSGRLPAAPEGATPERFLVLCPADAVGTARDAVGDAATIVPLPADPTKDPAVLVPALRERGLGRIVCEGGGRLATALLAAGLVDEFDQTLSPVLASGSPLLAGELAPVAARLAGLLTDATGRLYVRWDLRG